VYEGGHSKDDEYLLIDSEYEQREEFSKVRSVEKAIEMYCEDVDNISDESRTDILDELEIEEEGVREPIVAQTKSNFGILRPHD
jgi:hypothetical protein